MEDDPGVLADLPDDLRYLIAPALKYGRYQFDADIFKFLDRATGTEMEELAAVAERVLLNDHYSPVTAFLRLYPITEYEQSARLYFLFGILDHADLQFERAPADGS